MYDVIFEALRKLKGNDVCKMSKKINRRTEYILGIEKGNQPSHSFILDAASYYSISKDDIEKLNAFDDVNISMGMSHIERCEEIKSVLLKYYKRNRDIGKSIIYKRQ